MLSHVQPSNPREYALATFLRHQIIVASHLCEPAFDLLVADLDELVNLVMSKMALGHTQKEIHAVFAPWLDTPDQDDVFSHLCSWVFSTNAVLATQHQQLSMASTTTNATQRKYTSCLALPINKTNQLHLSRYHSEQ